MSCLDAVTIAHLELWSYVVFIYRVLKKIDIFCYFSCLFAQYYCVHITYVTLLLILLLDVKDTI